MNFKCCSISLLLIFVCATACKKNKPIDSIVVPTKDFREDYTGYFLADIVTNYIKDYQLVFLDTTKDVKILFTYNINDTVFYFRQGKIISQLPAIQMSIVDSTKKDPGIFITDHSWGMIDSIPGKMNYSSNNVSGVASIIQNNGGFIGKDSINFTYHYNEPHFARLYVIYAKRTK